MSIYQLFHFTTILLLTQWLGRASSMSSSPKVAQERWERLENEDLDPQAQPSSSCCRLFVWNLPSALCYHWGNRLKDMHTTEGRGGVKYVRIDEKGLLKYFWPCSRFRADACAICGHSWKEHLLLRWPGKDSPLDKHLDTILDQATRIKDGDCQKIHNRDHANLSSRNAFHRLYVTDREQQKPKDHRGPFSRHKRRVDDDNEMEWRESKGVFYSIPKAKDTDRKKKGWGLTLAYELVLGSLDDLIAIEKLEEGRESQPKKGAIGTSPVK